MEATFTQLKSCALFIILSLGFIIAGQTWARTTTLDHEQATLVSKFAKYVIWPTEARKREFVIGIYDNVEKYNYFSNFFANKGIRGKDIIVRLVVNTKEAQDVNILYVPSLNQNKFIKLADKISGSHVLIVSEDNKYNLNTMVDISYNKDDAKIILKINDEKISDEQLVMPDLAYFLDDKTNEEILTISPTALKKQRSEQLLALKNNLEQEKKILESQAMKQKALLDELTKKLELGKENAERNNLTLQKSAIRLKLAEQENNQKNQRIESQEKQLQQLKKQLDTLQFQLANNKEEPQISKQENTEKQPETAVEELTEKLKKQEGITKSTLIKLSHLTKENKLLTSFQMLFYVFVFIAVMALFIAVKMWNKAKSSASRSSSQVDNKNDILLPIRESQLIKSENLAAFGYIATDITFAVSVSLDDYIIELESSGDTKNITKIKPIVTLLDNFNHIAADQDDTDIQNFDVIAYMQKMMMLYDFEFSQSDVVYHYSGEKTLMIKSVPSFIALALLNLINNSLKHGFNNKGHGKITLKVENGAQSGAKITYSDDGKGMDKTTLKQVFTPFFTTRKDRGYVGVGMSTTYDLIKNKLAGDIQIESQVGKGTAVTITLP